MTFSVILAKDAAKKLSRLDAKTRGRILERLRQLKGNPHDPRYGKPLVNALGRWSSRVGSTCRIVYRIKRGQQQIIVDAIQSRGQVYRQL